LRGPFTTAFGAAFDAAGAGVPAAARFFAHLAFCAAAILARAAAERLPLRPSTFFAASWATDATFSAARLERLDLFPQVESFFNGCDRMIPD
jgi:hypothetical protein